MFNDEELAMMIETAAGNVLRARTALWGIGDPPVLKLIFQGLTLIQERLDEEHNRLLAARTSDSGDADG